MTNTVSRFAHAWVGLLGALALVAVANAQKTKEAWEYFKEPKFQSAYMRALGPKSKTPWLAKRDGPAPQDKFVTVGGEKFAMNAFCKNHDCNNNSAVLLYSPDHGAVYGTIYEKGRTTVIGNPPPAVTTELGKLWRKEWRSQG